ncbi:MAG: hypothetical protein GOMPHAMPRED_000882 [Gomphillus americanus]|uniref:Origin recognition complex subunit 4 n=1 Tax=Gomphillus americanus TaxID=1940652 RepID=A0A8H3F2K6_9LECA|nr:MAG: hypothetical protein GOMPHAMPRED_000882 [Gomphillus americanus]
MFAPSPRSNKRQKLNRDSTQGTKSSKLLERTSKLANGYSITTQDARAEGIPRSRQRAIETDDDTKSDFVDSAYHSMGTSPEEVADFGTAIANATTYPNGQDEIPYDDTTNKATRSKKRTKRGDTIDLPVSVAQATSETTHATSEEEHENTGSDSGVIAIRTSGRARTKTWKSVESEAKTQGTTTPRKHSRGGNGRLATSPPMSMKRKPQTDLRLSSPPVGSSVTTETMNGRLRMPSRRHQTVLTEEVPDQPEDEIAEASRTAEPNNVMRESESAGISDSVKKTKARISATPRKAGKKAQTTPLASPPQLTVKATKPVSPLSELLANDEYRGIMIAIRDSILKYLTATGPLPLYGEDHHVAYRKVYQILEQTVSAGEGNSMLLIGARGTAKTVLINMALEELGTEFRSQFHVVHLNGFIHTDDKLALKEMWRQLGREMAGEDSSQSDRVNYADTMASLLALLSQPEELSYGEGNRTTSKAVIFILDEFDLFTNHPRQTLLYNLFDIAQSRKAPIAVLGLTTRIDVVESLEKRVKSRFSHRYTYVSHPQSFSAYTSVIRAFLLASAHDEEGEISNHLIKSPALEELRSLFSAKFSKIHREWSSHIEQLFANPSILVLLNRHYGQTKSPQAFLNAFLIPIMNLPSLPEPADLLMNGLCPSDSNLDLLPSLTDASLALLIAAARLDIVCDTDTVTFNMAYDEYIRLAQRSRLSASASGMIAVSSSTSGGSKTVLGRDIALAAWEQLEEFGLLLPVAGQGGYGQVQGAMVDLGRGGRLVRVDIGLEEIGTAPGLELGAMARWCKEI